MSVDAAIAYARRGWPVLPLYSCENGRCTCGDTGCTSPGKHPIGSLVRHGLKDATTDTETIQHWWSKHPNANIGVRTGAESGFIVLDIDPRHGGDAMLEDLEAKHGKLPETVEQLTGGGGRHLLFNHPEMRVPTTKGDADRPGVDVKGDGGYIVVEPSIHASGRHYAWELSHLPDEHAIADAPGWLLDIVVSQHHADDVPGESTTTFKFDPSDAQEVAIAEAALKALKSERADDYDTWIKVGMILKSIDAGPMMCARWEEWSKQSKKWQKGECAKRWRTFSPDGRLTPATLVRMAHKDSPGGFNVNVNVNASMPSEVEAPEPSIKFAPFPIDVLPEPCQTFVRRCSDSIGCDACYIALPMLSALAASIGNTRVVQLKRGWTEPAIVWTVIVGESGTLKSPAFRVAVAPLKELQADALKRHAEEQRDHEVALTQHERELAEWKREKTNTDPPQKPDPPQPVRFIVSDTTIEALAPILEHNWRGVLLLRDELAGWLGSFDKYSGNARASSDTSHWLSMHSGDLLVVDRKTGPKKTIVVPRAAVSVAGGIQPSILQRAIGELHRQDGLAARLLFAYPPRRRRRWTDQDIGPDVTAKFALLLDKLIELRGDGEEDPEPIVVRLSSDAKAAWVRFYEQHAEQQLDLTGDLAAAWSKLEGYAARLALVIHMVRVVAHGADADQLDAESMHAGIALSRWFGREAERVYGLFHDTDEDRENRQLIELIQRKGGSVTARDLMRSCWRLKKAADAEAALEALVKAGIGTWDYDQSGQRGGKPSKLFNLIDSIDIDETLPNGHENRGIVNVNAVNGLSDGHEEVVI